MALGVALALSAVGAAPAYAQPASSIALESRAQALYQQGRERFVAGDFEQARAAFQSSLDTVDSPNTRMYLGRTLRRLGRDADAWAMLDRAARDADARAAAEPRYAPTRDAARAEADGIAPSLAWLTLDAPDAPEGIAVRVNGAALQRGGLGVTMPIAPGEVVVEASAPGRRDARFTLVLAAGQRELRSLALDPLPSPPPDAMPPGPRVTPPPILPPVTPPPPDRTALRVGGFIALGLGVASAAASVALGVTAFDAHDQLALNRETGRDLDEALKAEGVLSRDLSTGFAVGAIALGAASAAMLILGFRGPARPSPVTLHVGPGGVGGAF